MKFKEGDRVIHKINKTKFIINGRNVYRVGGYAYYLLPSGTQEGFRSDKPSGLRTEGILVGLEEELELDKQWYREQKINSLLA